VQTGERAVMFIERQRLCIEAFKVGAEHIKKLVGRRVSPLSSPSRIINCPERIARATRSPNGVLRFGQINSATSKLPGAGQLRPVVIEAEHGSHWISLFESALFTIN